MTAVEYIKLRTERADLIARVAARTAGFDALLMPTVAITAPPIAAFERDEDYRRLNALLLRNTSVINFIDCSALTVPLQTAGPPVGLMIVGEHGADRHLLAVGRGIEAVFSGTSLAPWGGVSAGLLAEQYQALIDYLGGKEGGQILDIMRWADRVHINRNDIETGKAA
jgi:Asp-tRNA(Asn)/Glu-tRNA(Gln) amidotransferase A subunit family amidase